MIVPEVNLVATSNRGARAAAARGARMRDANF
eukprot:SAG31_NODE_1332_length_8743_cov_20.800810_8_plen_32_part_00